MSFTGFKSILAPVPAGISRTTSKGRIYGGTTVTVDRLNNDFNELLGIGWVNLADHTGTTSARPLVDERGSAITPGFRYLDTTLSRVVVFAGSPGIGPVWIDDATGAPT